MTYEVAQTCILVNIGLTRGECASWVQAWGSIAALAVAGFIAVLQIRAARTHAAAVERNKQRALIEVIATLARLLQMEIESRASLLTAETDEESRRAWFTAGTPFADVYEAAKAMPIHEFPNVGIVQLAFHIQRLAVMAINSFQKMVVEYDNATGIFLRRSRPFALVLMGLQELTDRCNLAAAALNKS
jgi:hypothetical protein